MPGAAAIQLGQGLSSPDISSTGARMLLRRGLQLATGGVENCAAQSLGHRESREPAEVLHKVNASGPYPLSDPVRSAGALRQEALRRLDTGRIE